MKIGLSTLNTDEANPTKSATPLALAHSNPGGSAFLGGASEFGLAYVLRVVNSLFRNI